MDAARSMVMCMGNVPSKCYVCNGELVKVKKGLYKCPRCQRRIKLVNGVLIHERE